MAAAIGGPLFSERTEQAVKKEDIFRLIDGFWVAVHDREASREIHIGKEQRDAAAHTSHIDKTTALACR